MVSMLRCICWKRVASLFLKASSIADGQKMLALGRSEKQTSLPGAMLRHDSARERAGARGGAQKEVSQAAERAQQGKVLTTDDATLQSRLNAAASEPVELTNLG